MKGLQLSTAKHKSGRPQHALLLPASTKGLSPRGHATSQGWDTRDRALLAPGTFPSSPGHQCHLSGWSHSPKALFGGLQGRLCWREPVEAGWVAREQPQQGWRWRLLRHRRGLCVNRGCFVPAAPRPGGHEGYGLVSHPPVSHPLCVPHVAQGKCQPCPGRGEQNLSRGARGCWGYGGLNAVCAPWHGDFLARCHHQSITRPRATVRSSPPR